MPVPFWLDRYPSLSRSGYELTSPRTIHYNCIAWAAGETDRWWWPEIGSFWPAGVPLEASIDAFEIAFGRLGYAGPATPDLQPGVEKVAIYVGPDAQVTHMARQLPDGAWTSKCGRGEDIRHRELEALADLYGDLGRILERPRRSP